MGNCLFGGGMGDGEYGDECSSTAVEASVVQVATWSGGIMEFQPPITAGCIMKEFPGHFIFRSSDLFWKPLPHQQELVPGDSYCVLRCTDRPVVGVGNMHTRSKSTSAATNTTSSMMTTRPPRPYRMSFEKKGVLKKPSTEVLSRFSSKVINGSGGGGCGVWKVKLVISPEQLVEILSKENRTQELIENVATVARCGRENTAATSRRSSGTAGAAASSTSTTGGGSRASSMDFSELWSMSS